MYNLFTNFVLANLYMARFSLINIAFLLFATVLLWSCSSVKHVPEGNLLVDKVKIDIKDNSEVSSKELYNYLRQTPNHTVLGFAKLQLATYNMSGHDTTKWYNRWLRRLGQAPVLYNDNLTQASAFQLRQALINKGYLSAQVDVDTVRYDKKKKININYNIVAGEPHRISSISFDVKDTTIAQYIYADTALTTIKPGDLFDRNDLDAERILITERMRNKGFYAFNKEHITFTADTVAGSKDIDLTLNIHKAVPDKDTTVITHKHRQYFIRDIIYITDYNSSNDASTNNYTDTVYHKGITIIYGRDHYLRPGVLEECCHITPNALYEASKVDRTYESLGRLGILRFININLQPVAETETDVFMDAYIQLSRGRNQGVTIELEGTNSEGDLGFGGGITYQHRNLAKGSELLTTKFRAAYESISGDIEGFINDRYTEYAAEVGITFPKFMSPFLSKDFKQRMNATTQFAVSFNHQERPEYTRIIAGAGWKYQWANRKNTVRRTFDFLDINYVYLPYSTINFIDEIAPDNPLLRYSYEDHFIMKMGYTYYATNKRIPSSVLRRPSLQPSVYTLRASAETAGNVLYGLSHLFGDTRDEGAYKIFGIQYAQYVKADFDYTLNLNLNSRNTLSLHGGLGVGVPYGNSSMLPFEKRFYAGGANGVRGWNVRTLGPGRYDSRNSVSNFINQCGDIRLDLSLEYRAKLFWILEGALFVDAGNVWTIQDYKNQPDGKFAFDSFYKEIALAYGAGLRLDFTFFLLRFDLGMKAYNPAINQERWPLIKPNWRRDATFHFAVGYPF